MFVFLVSILVVLYDGKNKIKLKKKSNSFIKF